MRKLRVRSFINEVFNTYSEYFQNVYSICILLTSIILVIIALLLMYTNFGIGATDKWVTFYYALFYKYSKDGVYTIIDLSKTVYLLFAAFLAMSLYRRKLLLEGKESVSSSFLGNIKIGDVLVLALSFVVAGAFDIALYFIGYNFSKQPDSGDASKLVRNFFFELRIYFPILILAFAVSKRLLGERFLLNWYSFLTLIISAWIFNEFAYELSILVKNYVLAVITINFDNLTTKAMVESILSVPLFAFFLLGFASLMYLPLSFFQKNITQEQIN